MVNKNFTLVLDSDVINSLKGKGFIMSKIVRELLNIVDERTNSDVWEKRRKKKK